MGVIAVHDKLGADARFSDEDLRLGGDLRGARGRRGLALGARRPRHRCVASSRRRSSERRRLARELHDETGQALTSILLGVKAIRASSTPAEAERAESGGPRARSCRLCRTYARSRSSSGRRRSTTSASSRRSSASPRRSQERSGLETMVQANIDGRLPAEIETVLYRVVQEALTNVIKHAGAEHVSIVLRSREGRSR